MLGAMGSTSSLVSGPASATAGGPSAGRRGDEKGWSTCSKLAVVLACAAVSWALVISAVSIIL